MKNISRYLFILSLTGVSILNASTPLSPDEYEKSSATNNAVESVTKRHKVDHSSRKSNSIALPSMQGELADLVLGIEKIEPLIRQNFSDLDLANSKFRDVEDSIASIFQYFTNACKYCDELNDMRFEEYSPSDISSGILDEKILRFLHLRMDEDNNLGELIYKRLVHPREQHFICEFTRMFDHLVSSLVDDVNERRAIKKFFSGYPKLQKNMNRQEIETFIGQQDHLDVRSKLFLQRINPIIYGTHLTSDMPLDRAYNAFCLLKTIFSSWYDELGELRKKNALGPFVVALDVVMKDHTNVTNSIEASFRKVRLSKAEALFVWPINQHPQAKKLSSNWAEYEFRLTQKLDSLVQFYRYYALCQAYSFGVHSNDIKNLLMRLSGREYEPLPSASFYRMETNKDLFDFLYCNEMNRYYYSLAELENQKALILRIGAFLASFPLSELPALKSMFEEENIEEGVKFTTCVFSSTHNKLKMLDEQVESYTDQDLETVKQKAALLKQRTSAVLSLCHLLMRSIHQPDSKKFLGQLYRTIVCVNLAGLEIDEFFRQHSAKLGNVLKKLKSGTNQIERDLINFGPQGQDGDDQDDL